MIKTTITISNKLGLHARAAAKFVAQASKFLSELQVKKQNQTVNGKSIMGVMMLAANKGTELELIFDGNDEEEMRDAMVALIDNKFGEGE